ncbi:MAG: GNAT family N-acetyltransferase [Nanoarchaeota archaeon]
MIIRKIKRTEIDEVSKIVGKNYKKIYEKLCKKELGSMFIDKVLPPEYLIAEEKGKIVGFAGYSQSWIDYKIYEIFWVNVNPAFQNNGIGTIIVKKVIDKIKSKKGKTKSCSMILLTTKNPNFYKKRFKFKTIAKVSKKRYDLMALNLEKR